MSRHTKNIGIVVGGTIASRILGLIRDILLFVYLGTSALNSAFLFAFALPNLFRRLLGEGALSSAIIPVFSHEIEKKGEEKAFHFLNQAFTWVLVLLVMLVLLGISILRGLGRHQGFEERWYWGFKFGIVLLPYMIFVCLAALLSAALNVLERFGITSFSQVWLNLSMIVALSVFGSLFGVTMEGLVYCLCAGVLFGGFLQLIIPLFSLMKLGFRFRLDFEISEGISELAKLMLPGLAGAAIFQINTVISRLLAFSVDDQAVSILYLANRLIELPLGIFAIAIATVLFPSIAKLAAQKRFQEFSKEYQKGLSMTLAITVPAMVGLIVLEGPILRILFEWGRFSESDVALTEPVLMIYALGLPFYSLSTFATRGFHSLKDMKLPYRVALVIFGLNIGLSLILMFPYGMIGLACANLISAIVHAVILHYLLIKKESALKKDGFLIELGKIIGASFIMGCAAYSINYVVGINFGYGKLASFIIVGGGIPICILAYFQVLKLVKYHEMTRFTNFLH